MTQRTGMAKGCTRRIDLEICFFQHKLIHLDHLVQFFILVLNELPELLHLRILLDLFLLEGLRGRKMFDSNQRSVTVRCRPCYLCAFVRCVCKGR